MEQAAAVDCSFVNNISSGIVWKKDAELHGVQRQKCFKAEAYESRW